jgi:CTP synthase
VKTVQQTNSGNSSTVPQSAQSRTQNTSKQPVYIFVTGGVLSGLGKGVVSASIGKLLSKKYTIATIKCDGYLNVDPGTMNPIEHGEVFVLEDGAETDLDFGHYERFLNIDCKKDWSITSGKIFQSLVEKERRGDFLGKTVQVIPHATGEIRERLQCIAQTEDADVLIVEVGGTVGDLENPWYLWAAKEMRQQLGRERVLFCHLGLLPVIDNQGQQKTKPIQQSVMLLQQFGIFPDVIVGRSKEILSESSRDKIHWLCNVDKNAVASDPDLETVYELPLIFAQEGLAQKVSSQLQLELNEELTKWEELVTHITDSKENVTIAICGKYTELADSYISVVEALKHAGAHLKTKVQVKWVETTDFEKDEKLIQNTFADVDGIIVPGGFGTRGTEGKIAAVRFAREYNLPFLGICYGLQLAVIEFARNKCGLNDANSTEINPNTPHPVVDILLSQKSITDKGGTMRLGSYPAVLKPSIVANLYKKLTGDGENCTERHRHRYEVNSTYHQVLADNGLHICGLSPDGTLAEFIEIPAHPYFVATQAHPELKSRLERPAPLFYGLVQAALEHKKQ